MNLFPNRGSKPLSKKVLFAHSAAVLANIIFGVNYVVAKGIMPDYMAPRAVIFIRVFGAVLIFWLISWMMPSQKIERRDLFRIMVAAIFGVALNQIMFFEGLNLTTPINASIIMVGVPILVMMFAYFIIGETINTNKIIGIVLGFVGSAFLIVQAGGADLGQGMLGNLLIFVNVSSYALFLVLIKPLMSKYHPLTVMKWVFLFGFVFIFPFTAELAWETNYHLIPVTIWFSVGFVVVFTTVLAYFLNNYSLTIISPTVNSAYIYFQPFLATFVAITFGKDQLTLHEIIAAVLIFTGVYFVNFKQSTTKKH